VPFNVWAGTQESVALPAHIQDGEPVQAPVCAVIDRGGFMRELRQGLQDASTWFRALVRVPRRRDQPLQPDADAKVSAAAVQSSRTSSAATTSHRMHLYLLDTESVCTQEPPHKKMAQCSTSSSAASALASAPATPATATSSATSSKHVTPVSELLVMISIQHKLYVPVSVGRHVPHLHVLLESVCCEHRLLLLVKSCCLCRSGHASERLIC
jgi:hypothetical protein